MIKEDNKFIKMIKWSKTVRKNEMLKEELRILKDKYIYLLKENDDLKYQFRELEDEYKKARRNYLTLSKKLRNRKK